MPRAPNLKILERKSYIIESI